MKIANLTVLAILALAAAGCAVPPVVQEVKIPVYTSCVKVVPVRPAFESVALPATASDGEKVLALARDTLQHFKHEARLEAVIAGCL